MVITFLTITLFMFYISPLQWPMKNGIVLLFYNGLVCLSLFLGFNFGVRRYNTKINLLRYDIKYPIVDLLKANINKLLILNLIFIYPKFVMKMGKGFVSLEYIFNSIILGFIYPEMAYTEKFLGGSSEFLSLTHPLVFLYFILSPILFVVIPIMFYLWDELELQQKIMTIIIVVFDVFVSISVGTNKGIFDFVIMLPFIFYVKRKTIISNGKILLNKKKIVTVIVLFSVFSLGYFTKTIVNRTGAGFGFDTATGKYVDNESLILKIIPMSLQNGYISLDYYLTQGYYALDNSFDLEFLPTYGFGHSNLLTSIAEKIIGTGEINSRTYQYRLESAINYSQSTRWHTFYVSFANDLTFIGTLPFIFLLGYWFSIVWLDIIFRKNLIAVGIMPLFMITFFYFSANNQVLGNEGQSFIFWILLITLFKSRQKINATTKLDFLTNLPKEFK